METFNEEKIKKINEDIIFGKDSIGRTLINFIHNLITDKRKDERNQLIFYMNSFEKKFAQNFEKYRYEFIDNNTKENNKETNEDVIPLQSHPKLLFEKLDKKIEKEISKCDENSSPFKILINYHDLIYKENLEVILYFYFKKILIYFYQIHFWINVFIYIIIKIIMI